MCEQATINSLLLNMYDQKKKKGFKLVYSWTHSTASEYEKQSPLLTATKNEIKAFQFWVTETDV